MIKLKTISASKCFCCALYITNSLLYYSTSVYKLTYHLLVYYILWTAVEYFHRLHILIALKPLVHQCITCEDCALLFTSCHFSCIQVWLAFISISYLYYTAVSFVIFLYYVWKLRDSNCKNQVDFQSTAVLGNYGNQHMSEVNHLVMHEFNIFHDFLVKL